MLCSFCKYDAPRLISIQTVFANGNSTVTDCIVEVLGPEVSINIIECNGFILNECRFLDQTVLAGRRYYVHIMCKFNRGTGNAKKTHNRYFEKSAQIKMGKLEKIC